MNGQHKKKPDPICDPGNYTTMHYFGFDTETVSREEVLAHIKQWEPRGSGNHMACHLALIALHLVAKLRNFEPFTQDEIEKTDLLEARALLEFLHGKD